MYLGGASGLVAHPGGPMPPCDSGDPGDAGDPLQAMDLPPDSTRNLSKKRKNSYQ